MTGIVPTGREYASELKYPALTLYDQRWLSACDVVTPAPYICPAPRPTVEPALRSKYPALNVTFVVPAVSRGDFVMMLTTPVNAFAPQTADAGPRTTSICLISAVLE